MTDGEVTGKVAPKTHQYPSPKSLKHGLIECRKASALATNKKGRNRCGLDSN